MGTILEVRVVDDQGGERSSARRADRFDTRERR